MLPTLQTVDACSAIALTGSGRQLARVMHVINGEHYSGAERVQDLLAAALPQFGYAAGFAAIKPGRFGESRAFRDAPLFELPMRSRWDRGPAGEIARICREDDYRLVHAHTPRSLLVAADVARQTGLPLVYHVHSPVGRDSARWLRNSINRWVESRLLRRCARMICVSGSLREYMLGLGHPASRLAVVRNGVPCSDQPPPVPPRGGWTLGMVALFRPRKGLEVLLEALAAVGGHGFDFRLLAVGPFETPEYEREIHRRAAELGLEQRIEWTGFDRDVNSRLRQMHALVLPSLYGEGLPMVVLEAMACGVPIIASRVEGTPEAVRDGVDGLLCDPGDPRDLARKIRELAADPDGWLSMGRNARARQKMELSDRAMARGVATVYDEILDRDGGSRA